MRKVLIPLALLAAPLAAPTPAAAQASAAVASGKVAPSPLSPSEIVAAAPKADWVAIPASDLLVMYLDPGDGGTEYWGMDRRVVIQLMPPPFSQGWIGNIRTLAKAHWWDGLSINRVQDNYVVQWGDADGEDTAKARKLPAGLATVPEIDYVSGSDQEYDAEMARFRRDNPKTTPIVKTHAELKRARQSFIDSELSLSDVYAKSAGFTQGWPVAADAENGIWPVHCYGMVGVGRDLSPSTGTGAELYTVIGHAPRHLDRNIALVGRVIEGIEHLSSLPRGTGTLGFYETPEERTEIASVRLGPEVAGLAAYEYLSTESASFARYADARANRRDPFFIRPAGGADICNIPVPVRRVK